MSRKKKLLFFSHAVTMAHFTRPLKWIETLDHDVYDIYFASHPSLEKFAAGVTFIPIRCIDAATFENHIAEDMMVIDRVQPDLVIGDFRHSLSVSCRLKNVKYINEVPYV